jgi:hypothetical protein
VVVVALGTVGIVGLLRLRCHRRGLPGSGQRDNKRLDAAAATTTRTLDSTIDNIDLAESAAIELAQRAGFLGNELEKVAHRS